MHNLASGCLGNGYPDILQTTRGEEWSAQQVLMSSLLRFIGGIRKMSFDKVAAKSQKGASLVEYALLIALIAVIAIVAIRSVGTATSGRFSNITSTLG